MDQETINSLDAVPPGRRIRVRQLRGGINLVEHLKALGITDGVELQVVQNGETGPLVVLMGEAQVSLGRGVALKVLVEKVEG